MTLMPTRSVSKHAPRKNPTRLAALTFFAACFLACHFVETPAFILRSATLNSERANAHGFNANRVRIMRTLSGKHRVIIRYSHVEIGEYREAHVDFDTEVEAIAAYQQLAQGADFFLGDITKSLHFHKPPQKNVPY
jgi:hypothetical protein